MDNFQSIRHLCIGCYGPMPPETPATPRPGYCSPACKAECERESDANLDDAMDGVS